MERVLGWIRHYALSVVLLLTAAAAGVGVYAVLQVQSERSATILRECLAQNARHKGTVKELDLQISQLSVSASPARRAQLKASKGLTVLLIDQLAPYRDCQQVLAKSTSR